MTLMVTVCYEDGAYRVGGLPDNQTLAFDTLADMSDAAKALLDAVDTHTQDDALESALYMVGENL